MRQFVTWRFWLSLIALGVALGVVLIVRDQAQSSPIPGVVAAGKPVERRVDLIAMVLDAHPDAQYGTSGGVTTGTLGLVLDGGRRLSVPPGTPVDQHCVPAPASTASSSCALAADLLGDAVVWFALVDAQPKGSIDLPAVVSVRAGGWTLLRNGWEVQRASTVERACDADTNSLTDFLHRFGPTSVTTFSLVRQKIVKVSCSTP